jgi:hypothetical protein
MMRVLFCIVALFALLAVPALAAPAGACGATEYRQFDFWVGNWTVTGRKTGKFAGTNNVTKPLGNCVVMEHWTGARGLRGSSFNTYDPGRRRWHQTWVDDSGTLLLLDGGMQSGSMVLTGASTASDGKTILNRVTWTPLSNGTVRQHWTISTDGGRTWSDAFDGIYTRAKPKHLAR